MSKIEICEYRGHLCQVVTHYDGNEADLKIMAEILTDSQYAPCDCMRSEFLGVHVPQENIVVVEIIA